ncbi:hypothetical protein L484_016254 [Morus notabilis]|uniref:Uncharacterized protein n=1 Tax=Morus notabilis TaxID=981085 RepID=W9REQ1_9ROSA|nr:hypothetical protein L484_016254 [Morus notabilis]
MHNLSLVAYSVFFNASKALFFICLILVALLYVFIFSSIITDIQELAAFLAKKKGSTNLALYMMFQENLASQHSNGSYHEVLRSQ